MSIDRPHPQCSGSRREFLWQMGAGFSGIALTALAPSTIFQLAGADGAALRAMRSVVERVPSYLLELGEDTAQIPAVIAALLAGRQA